MNDLGERIDIVCEGLPEFEDMLWLRMKFQQLWSSTETDRHQERRCNGTFFENLIFQIFSGSLELLDWGVAQLTRLLAEV